MSNQVLRAELEKRTAEMRAAVANNVLHAKFAKAYVQFIFAHPHEIHLGFWHGEPEQTMDDILDVHPEAVSGEVSFTISYTSED